MEIGIQSAVRRICSSGLATEKTLSGCTSQEIERLEAELEILLPAAYQEFLACCGKGAGEFLVGTDWTYPMLIGLQTAASALIRGFGIEDSLPETAFVFAMHQGYQFLFFDCSGGDDPPVKLFLEGEVPRQVFESFSQWLSQCVADESAAYGELK